MLIHAETGQVRAGYERSVPHQDLAIILIATMAIKANDMRTIRGLAGPVLNLPELPDVVVGMGRILSKLITVNVIARVRRYRLASFVSCLTMMTIVRRKQSGGCEIGRLCRELFSARRICRALEIIRCEPKVIPTIAFDGNIAPLREEREELRLTILVAAARRLTFLVGCVPVIRNAFHGRFLLLLQAIRFFYRTMSTPIVVDVLRDANDILISFRVMKGVAGLIMVLVTRTAHKEGLKVSVLYAISRAFMRYLRILRLRTF